MKTLRGLAAALALPALVACGSTPEPEPVFAPSGGAVAPDPITDVGSVAGVYTLVGYGTVPLPFTVERNEAQNCVEEVTEGALTLNTDGTWAYRYVERDVCRNGEGEIETEDVGGTFAVRDGRLFFDETWGEDGPEGDGVMEARDLEVGWLQAGELRVEPEGIDGIWLRFRR